jgi:hypothetical protein
MSPLTQRHAQTSPFGPWRPNRSSTCSPGLSRNLKLGGGSNVVSVDGCNASRNIGRKVNNRRTTICLSDRWLQREGVIQIDLDPELYVVRTFRTFGLAI